MTWRTVILTKESKVSLRMNHLMVTAEDIVKIPIVEIGIVIIENPNIVLTGHILNALSENKITTIICDQKHIPAAFIHTIYGHHRQSKNLQQQFNWQDERKGMLWKEIIRQKIFNQGRLLFYLEKEGFEELKEFINCVELHDLTNREGHAAKVYFNRLFGKDFIRGNEDAINWGLNYGYSLLHALITRQIVSKGYLSEIGIHHINEYNQFNFSSDLIEVFRPIVDFIVFRHIDNYFGKEEKRKITEMLNQKIFMRNGEHFLSQAIQIYIDNCIHYLNTGDEEKLLFPDIRFENIRI